MTKSSKAAFGRNQKKSTTDYHATHSVRGVAGTDDTDGKSKRDRSNPFHISAIRAIRGSIFSAQMCHVSTERSTPNSFSSTHAFSLVEMIVSVAILSIIAVITFRYIAAASETYALLSAQREVVGETATAVSSMRREIRTLQTPLTADVGEFSFVNQDGLTNTFRLNGTEITLNGYTLARNVTSFTLAYYDATNGLLSPVPLDSTDLALVRRIGVDLDLSKGRGHTSFDANIFLQTGVRK